MWRTLDATGKRGPDSIADCGRATCMATPLHPELWADLQATGGSCAPDGDTMRAPHEVFGLPIRPFKPTHSKGHKHK